MTLEFQKIESSSRVQNNCLTSELFSNSRLKSCFLVLQSYFLNSELLTIVLIIAELNYFLTSSIFSHILTEDVLPLISRTQ